MAETSNQGEEESQQRGPETQKTQRSDGSVVLDMEGLSLLVDPGIGAANAAPDDGTIARRTAPMMLQKALSRKFSQRGETKAATADSDNKLLPSAAAAGNGGGRGVTAPLHAAAAAAAAPPKVTAADKFVAVVLSPTASPKATAAAASPRQSAPCRRAHARRVAASWLDPRRVLIFFATLSSMGTIILLYFTLSMGRMGDGDANAR